MKSKLKIKMHRILSTAADYIEITISILIILLVIVFVLRLASEMYTTVVDMFVHKTANISFDEIISLIFELIIGIELVKMLSNHAKIVAFCSGKAVAAQSSFGFNVAFDHCFGCYHFCD